MDKVSQNLDSFIDQFLSFREKSGLSRKIIEDIYLGKQQMYSTFRIPKKNGGFRRIEAPHGNLLLVQQVLSDFLQSMFIPKIAANGFVRGRSIVTNAAAHVNKKYVLNIDLKNFFPSISESRIRKVIQLPPLNFSEEIAEFITELCTFKRRLPQGAPTSPVLSNIVCQALDRKIIRLGQKRFGRFHYSRYADDLTFSSNKEFPDELLEAIKRVVHSEGFRLNPKKTRLLTQSDAQVVTGLVVNKKINVPRKFVRELRALLYSWKHDGYELANKKFIFYRILQKQASDLSPKRKKELVQKFIKSSISLKLPRAVLLKTIEGRLAFMKSVKGAKDSIYKKYHALYLELSVNYLRGVNTDTFTLETKMTPEVKESVNKGVREEVKEEVSKKEKSRIWGPHSPLYTAEIFSYFRTTNETGLRELVHTPTDPVQFELHDYVDRAKKFLNERRFPDKDNWIPIKIWGVIKSLVELYDKEGLVYWDKNRKHPFLSDEKFTHKIQALKKKIRFGQIKEETTLITSVLENIAKKKPIQLNFLKDKEALNATFDVMTSVESVRNVLEKVFENIVKHAGRLKIDETKMSNKVDIDVNLREDNNQWYVVLTINHINSKCRGVPEILGNGDFSSMKETLWSLCHWTVKAMFSDNKSYCIRFLSDETKSIKEENYIECLESETVDGFIHEFKFFI